MFHRYEHSLLKDHITGGRQVLSKPRSLPAFDNAGTALLKHSCATCIGPVYQTSTRVTLTLWEHNPRTDARTS